MMVKAKMTDKEKKETDDYDDKNKDAVDDELFADDLQVRLEKKLASIDKRDILSRVTSFWLTIFSAIAGVIDNVKNHLLALLMKIPAPEIIKQSLHTAGVVTNFKAMIDFIRIKYYAFKKAPYNEKLVHSFEELQARAHQQGVDFKHQFPDLIDRFVERKNHILQHSYFKEFNKSPSERMLAIPFSFTRSLSPVLPDRALWHKLFGLLAVSYTHLTLPTTPYV